MEKQKMTIHRALSELKLIDAKIEKQINELEPNGIHQKGKLINGHITEVDLQKAAQSKYDSVIELIKRKTLIKSAIVKTNGETKVKVGGKEMSIADAITFKTVVEFKKQLVERLKLTHSHWVGQLNKNNEVIEKNVQTLLEHTFGKEGIRTGKEDLEAVRRPYMEANEFHLFDPLKVKDKIEMIENEIAEFEADVDAVLSEINAVTFIEI